MGEGFCPRDWDLNACVVGLELGGGGPIGENVCELFFLSLSPVNFQQEGIFMGGGGDVKGYSGNETGGMIHAPVL